MVHHHLWTQWRRTDALHIQRRRSTWQISNNRQRWDQLRQDGQYKSDLVLLVETISKIDFVLHQNQRLAATDL